MTHGLASSLARNLPTDVVMAARAALLDSLESVSSSTELEVRVRRRHGHSGPHACHTPTAPHSCVHVHDVVEKKNTPLHITTRCKRVLALQPLACVCVLWQRPSFVTSHRPSHPPDTRARSTSIANGQGVACSVRVCAPHRRSPRRSSKTQSTELQQHSHHHHACTPRLNSPHLARNAPPPPPQKRCEAARRVKNLLIGSAERKTAFVNVGAVNSLT
jgi:hypothetical protein